MKTIYIAYKFKEQNPVKLRERLEELSEVIEESLKCKTFIFFRDAQNWGEKKMDVKELVKRACKEIKKCDVLLVEASEKARGAYFEVGYAKALKKKIIVIHQEGTEADFLKAAGDVSIEYEDLEDLREKLESNLI